MNIYYMVNRISSAVCRQREMVEWETEYIIVKELSEMRFVLPAGICYAAAPKKSVLQKC